MKKIVAVVLLMCMVLSLAACGKVKITMQEIYDANQPEAILKNHQSMYVQDEVDGALDFQGYLTKDFVYCYYAVTDWSEFLTDDAYFYYYDGEYGNFLPVSPDGVSDIASYRAKHFAMELFAPDTVYETIESVSKKDGRITVKSFFDQEALENYVDGGMTSGKFEYVLDAKTNELISSSTDTSFDDGTAYHLISKISHDVEAPEEVKAYLEYANQTEDLRNVTVVTNPGTGEEVSQSFLLPRGLVAYFYTEDYFDATYELYNDAACTEYYDPYADLDSDLTVYVKWTE